MKEIESLLEVVKNTPKVKDGFNPFTETSFGKLENTHSDLIVKFLKADIALAQSFFEIVLKQEWPNAELKVSREKGRIDILIEYGKNESIIIENKINASDQPKQLQNYHEYTLNHKGTKPRIFYLTPYGTNPSEDSKGDLEVKCISYENDILSWLEEFKTEDQALKHAIQFYIELIRKTINRNKYMTDILKKIFTGENNHAKDAINLYLAMNGKNFLDIPEIKEKFENLIYICVSNNHDPEDWADTKDNCRELSDLDNNIDFYITGSSIYAEKNNSVRLGEEIRCNDLGDENLCYLLAGETEDIQRWVDRIYKEAGAE